MARPRGDIEKRLLTSARRCFLAQGFAGTSLREVARAAGTSVGMIHYYHRSKQALFQAVIEATYSRTLADLETALSPDASFGERTLRLYAKLGSLSDEERETVRMVIREVMTDPLLLKGLLERSLRGHIPLLLRLVADGQSEGRIRKELSPPVVMACIMGIGILPTFMHKAGTQFIRPHLLRPGTAKGKLPPPFKRMAQLAVNSLPSAEELPRILQGIALSAFTG